MTSNVTSCEQALSVDQNSIRTPVNYRKGQKVTLSDGTISKVYPTTDTEAFIFEKVQNAIDAVLFSKHEDKQIPELTKKLTKLWGDNKEKFAQDLEPHMTNIEKVAFHIFNLYRAQELTPILQSLEKNPSTIGLSSDEWPHWKETISREAWHHVQNMHSLPVAVALDPLLQTEFSEIVPESRYIAQLHVCEHQGKGLPKLRHSIVEVLSV